MTKLERLRQLDAEATGGPWRARQPIGQDGVVYFGDGEEWENGCTVVRGRLGHDATLIAEARNALPDLLAAASVIEPWKLERIAKVLDYFDRVVEIADKVLPGEKENYAAVDHTEMQDDLRKLAKALDRLWEGET